MGIKQSAKQVVVDFMVGRAIRKIEAQGGVAAALANNAEEDELRALFADAPDTEETAKIKAALAERGVDVDNTEVVALSTADLVRRAVYDSGHDDPEGVFKAMGWDTPSAEVVEMEERASQVRCGRVAPLSDLVHAMSHAACLPSATTDGWDAEELHDEAEFTAHALLSVLAQLVDMGLVHMGTPLASVALVQEGYDD